MSGDVHTPVVVLLHPISQVFVIGSAVNLEGHPGALLNLQKPPDGAKLAGQFVPWGRMAQYCPMVQMAAAPKPVGTAAAHPFPPGTQLISQAAVMGLQVSP
jgi:hypothetical protein